MRRVFALCIIGLLAACGNKMVPGNVVKFLSAEDEAVLELLASIKKDPTNKSLLEMLPGTYQRAMDSRIAMKDYVMRDNPPGDRWVYWRKQLEASQSITDAVLSYPPASAVIANPVQFRNQISDARVQAAAEYYDLAMGLLAKQDRRDARTAIDYLQKAQKESPGYKDVADQLRNAKELATLYVVVNPVDYYSFGWNYWGFQNDYLQWQMLRDLNNRSYSYTRFVSEQEARTLNKKPEKVVDMRFARLMVYNPYTERNTFERQKQIEEPGSVKPGIGEKALPSKTITVKATVTVTKRLVKGDADLECRIFDLPTGRNILYDHFPGRYNWVFESATFTGDQRALTADDLRLINNRFDQYPTREEVGQKLINDAYASLLSRIEQGVKFDSY